MDSPDVPTVEPPRALAGLRVLELGEQLCVAYATRLLADLGADVLKVEGPGGDPHRGEGPTVNGTGALFHYVNANKRGTSLDLDDPDGAALLRRLVADNTMVVEGLGPGGLERRGLSLRRLIPARRPFVLARVSPFGQHGGARDEPTTALTLQAAAGWVNDRGVPGLAPVQVGGRLDEYVVGGYAACAALTALAAARRHAMAVEVDISSFLCLHNTMPYPGVLQDTLRQLGWADFKASATPLGIQPCRDGYVGINILTAQHWSDACSLLGLPQYADRQDDLKRDDRLLEEFRGQVRAWLSDHDAEEVIELFQRCRIPATPIGTGQSMPGYSHWRDRPFFSDEASPGGAFRHPGFPWRMSRTPPAIRRPAPSLGPDSGIEATSGPAAPTRGTASAGALDASETTTTLPFSGLRVLDLGVFWAAPYLACFLGAFGADVIKVESIQRPDPFRFSMAFPALGPRWWECSPLWQGPNFNKRGLALDLSSEEGRSVFLRLVADADVVVENFSTRVLPQLRLDYDDLVEVNPSIVMVRMPGFGLGGPWRDYVGWGNAFEQVGGQCQVTGYPDGDPQNPGGFADPTVAFHAGVALLAALEHRRATGEGQLVEVSQIEVVACTTAEQVIVHSLTGEVADRMGNRSPVMAPQGVYPCDHGTDFVALSVRDDAEWLMLRKALGDPSWARCSDWDNLSGRQSDHAAIDEQIGAWTSTRSADEVAALLREAGIPVAPVFTVERIYRHPQIQAYGYYQDYEHPVTGRRLYPGWPMQLSCGPARPHHRPSILLGQHNEEILAELGLESEHIAALQSAGVIGTEPVGL